MSSTQAFGLCLLILTAGCSQEQLYNNIHNDQIRQCEQLPPGAYENCMKGRELTFDEYEAERQKILKSEDH